MFIDQMAMILVAMVFSLPLLLYDGARADSSISLEKTTYFFYHSIFLWSIYFNKDIYRGRSLGKIRSGLQIVDIKSGRAADPLKCLIRNLFIFIWPIELIIVLVSPQRRLGDFVAGTKLQAYTSESTEDRPAIPSMIISVLLSWGILYFVIKWVSIYLDL
jgi:hypothetical protein